MLAAANPIPSQRAHSADVKTPNAVTSWTTPTISSNQPQVLRFAKTNSTSRT